jgi:prepilin peptidase CpaA
LPAVGVAVVALAVGFGLFATNIFGAGDVKLAVVTLLWAGPTLALPVVLITSLVGGVMAVIMLSRIRFGIAKALNTMGQRTLGDAFLAKDMPYGVAIATGGLFVGWFLLTGA